MAPSRSLDAGAQARVVVKDGRAPCGLTYLWSSGVYNTVWYFTQTRSTECGIMLIPYSTRTGPTVGTGIGIHSNKLLLYHRALLVPRYDQPVNDSGS